MADDKPEDAGLAPESGRAKRTPPTIDLEATEVSTQPQDVAGEPELQPSAEQVNTEQADAEAAEVETAKVETNVGVIGVPAFGLLPAPLCLVD